MDTTNCDLQLTYLYVFRYDNETIKVGITNDLKRRLQQHKKCMYILFVLKFTSRKRAKNHESKICASNPNRKLKEWFKGYSDNDITEILKDIWIKHGY